VAAGDPIDPAPVALAAAILAGGAGRRMGAPKAALPLAGRPMISYAIDAARAAGLSPFVVTKAGIELPELDCRLVVEPAEPRHPLCGVIAALEHHGGPVVVIACDVPLLPPGLLSRLARSTADLALPVHPRPQPLVARYSPSLLPRLRAALAAGEAMVDLAASLGGDRLGETELRALGDPAWMFANANDPAELDRVEAEVLRRRQRD